MTMPSPPPPQDEVWDVVRRINQAWALRRTEDLEALLHAEIVVAPPSPAEPVRGREACIESYREFALAARVLHFEELHPAVEVFGDTAVAAYDFAITYEADGTYTTERGREIFVLTREDGRWRAVWRTQLPPSMSSASD
ncbi:MAG: nuclear transport factor 2 family protein [Dehalococcoidia bacterium]